MAPVMNRLLRPFGLKLGPLQAGAVYTPLHFLAVGIGLTLLIAPQGVAVFWPATGALFAFLLLYPPRYWLAIGLLAYVGELAAHTWFAPDITPNPRSAVAGSQGWWAGAGPDSWRSATGSVAAPSVDARAVESASPSRVSADAFAPGECRSSHAAWCARARGTRAAVRAPC